MRILVLALALLASTPAAAQTRNPGWAEVGRASYERTDYGRSGPTRTYYAPGSFVIYSTPGPHTYANANGTRVWYGSTPTLAPVLTTAPVALPQGPALRAPASPGPRVYVNSNGVRIWYGQ